MSYPGTVTSEANGEGPQAARDEEPSWLQEGVADSPVPDWYAAPMRWPGIPPLETFAPDVRDVIENDRCRWRKRSGALCKKPALDPRGEPPMVYCRYHTLYATAQAARQQGAGGTPNLAQVLYDEIERTQLMIAWYEAILDEAVDDVDALLQVTIDETRQGGPGGDYTLQRTEQRAHPALTLLMQEREHLATVVRFAVQNGIEMKQLELNQQLAGQLILAMQILARRAGLDPADARVRAMIADAMRAAKTERAVDVPAGIAAISGTG